MLVVLGATMVLFLAQDAISSFGSFFGSGDADKIGEAYGEKIPQEYYAGMVDVEQSLSEALNPNQPQTAEQLEPRVWQQLMDQIVIGREVEAVGLFDTDAERWQRSARNGGGEVLVNKLTPRQYAELFYGQDPHPIITSNFGSGAEFRQRVNEKLPPNSTPEQQQQYYQRQRYYEALKLYVERQHVQQAYGSLLKMGGLVSKAHARQDYLEANTRYDVDYCAVTYSALADSLFPIEESELQAYYNNNLERYAQDRDEALVDFVRFPTTATARDSALLRGQLQQLQARWQQAADDSAFAELNNQSSVRFANGWQNSEELDQQVKDLIAGQQAGALLGPVQMGSQFRIMKLTGREERTDRPFVKLRYMMVAIRDTTQTGKAEALKKAEALRAETTPENFQQLLFDQSKNEAPSVFQDRGELGWHRYGQFAAIDEAVRSAQKGQIIGPVALPGAYLILEVQERNTSAIRLSTIAADIRPSDQTLDSLKRQADALISETLKEADVPFAEKAKKLGYTTQQSQPLFSGQSYIAQGISGDQAKEIIRWALDEERVDGDVRADVLQTESAYYVLSLKERKPEGYLAFSKVEERVKAKVLAEKKAAAILARMSKIQIDTNLTRVATAFGPGAFASTAAGITFDSPGIQGTQDPVLIGKLTQLKSGQLSKPIKGEAGVYLVYVRRVTQPDKLSDEVIEQHRSQLQSRQQGEYQRSALEGLKDAAGIKDYRYRF
ncbi:MAG: peptidyl-prolyl cis-trans isomerase [Bacteroidetes bacterium]|nr:peptidyl-prolyl cis-trans isomerase [Bacteroidota bacterium]